MSYTTEQEHFWANEFGDSYVERNRGKHLIASNLALFTKVLVHTYNVRSILELGANIGLNFIALKQLVPEAQFSAVEINGKAIEELRNSANNIKIYHQSILDFVPETTSDFVLIKGVLIHINPEKLSHVYATLYQSSHRYICLVEYYNPTPIVIPYRGHDNKLFKRDFAGELLDKYPNLKLVAYGFTYHRDPNFPQDDANWFLLEKS